MAASGSSQSAIMLPTQVDYSYGGVLRTVSSASHPAVVRFSNFTMYAAV